MGDRDHSQLRWPGTDLHPAIFPGGGDPLSVRRELQAVHHLTVALVREDAALPADVPDLEGADQPNKTANEGI